MQRKSVLFLLLLSLMLPILADDFESHVRENIRYDRDFSKFTGNSYDVFQHENFDLQTLIELKFEDGNNNFWLRDYKGDFPYAQLEKIYYKKNYRDEDAYFISLKESGSRMVYEVKKDQAEKLEFNAVRDAHWQDKIYDSQKKHFALLWDIPKPQSQHQHQHQPDLQPDSKPEKTVDYYLMIVVIIQWGIIFILTFFLVSVIKKHKKNLISLKENTL